MADAIETMEGWYALHDFRKVDWLQWRALSDEEREEGLRQLMAMVTRWQTNEADHDGSTGVYQIIGHKADLLFVNLRPTMDDLIDIEFDLDRSGVGPLLTQSYSYFSIVELSKYLVKGGRDPMELPGTKDRLFPILPKDRYVCFYPMNKRRAGRDNWYSLSKDERRDLMKGHGILGHKYADRVTQIITGSQGLDDWEWGVTLYSNDVVDFKKLIYEMRFDPTSARFADFGPFLVGRRLEAAALRAYFS